MREYPHMCRMDHQEIGHNDSESELCPLCRALNELTAEREHSDELEKHLKEALMQLQWITLERHAAMQANKAGAFDIKVELNCEYVEKTYEIYKAAENFLHPKGDDNG